MHILLIHQAFASLNEAGGTRHYEMARALAKHGHRITIIASPVSYITGKESPDMEKSGNRQQPVPGVTILRVKTYAALHKSFVHRILSFFSFMITSFFAGLKTQKVDLVWGTSPPIFQGFTIWLLSVLKRVPFLFEVRDLWPSFAISVGVLKNKTLIRWSLWLESFLYRHADVVVVNSPGYIRHVQNRGAHRVCLIPNGVDTDMFETDPRTVNPWLARKEGKKIALYAGAHGISNDLITLLQAARWLEKETDIQIWLVGDGKEKPALEKLAAEMQLTNVRFFPSVSKQEMNQVLEAADICIASLLPLEEYKTTYPNKVFDYMAAKKAVILAIDGVIRNVVEEAKAGVFVSPGNDKTMADAICYNLYHPQECTAMGISGYNYVRKNFSRAMFTEEFRLLIEKMVNTDDRKNSGC